MTILDAGNYKNLITMSQLINEIQVTFTDLTAEVKKEQLLADYNKTVEQTHRLFSMKYPDMFAISHLDKERVKIELEMDKINNKAGS